MKEFSDEPFTIGEVDRILGLNLFPKTREELVDRLVEAFEEMLGPEQEEDE